MVANPLVLRPLRRCVDSPAFAVASQKRGVSTHCPEARCLPVGRLGNDDRKPAIGSAGGLTDRTISLEAKA